MCLCVIYIFRRLVCLFCCSKICRLMLGNTVHFWEYINGISVAVYYIAHSWMSSWHLLRAGRRPGCLDAVCCVQRWAIWRLSTFDLYPGGVGHGVQGQICDILRPASYESLPVASGHTDSHTLDTYICGGGQGGALIFWIDVEHLIYLQVSMPPSGKKDPPCLGMSAW